MDPITAMAIAQGVAGLTKAGLGYINKRQAEQEREELLAAQPQMETPLAISEMSDLYQRYLSEVQGQQGMPGQEMMEQNLRESVAGGIRGVRETARTSGEALAATTDLVGREIEGIQQLEIEGARQQAQRELQATQLAGRGLQIEGQFQQQAFMMNEYAPWQTRLAQAQAEFAGGQQTLQSGLGDLFSAATTYGINQAGGASSGDNQSAGSEQFGSEGSDNDFMYDYWRNDYLPNNF